MPSDLQITNIKDQANANSAITIASDGQITVNQNNPTITLGSNTTLSSTVSLTNATFPAGHIITTSTIAWDKSADSDIQMNTTTFGETGIEVSITPKLSAGSSKIVVVFNSGAVTQTEVGTTNEATVGRATSSSTAYSGAHNLSDTMEPTQVYTPSATSRLPICLRFVDDSGYSAGTTYYYQLYAKASSSTYGYRVVRSGANYSMIAYEIKQ